MRFALLRAFFIGLFLSCLTVVFMTRERMTYDVVIVGAGPAGLSAAIRLKQLNANLSICVVEKAPELGAHSLSGAVFETRALDELLPDWQEMDAPLHQKVTKDQFLLLSSKKAWRLPIPPQMKNKNKSCYIISLGEFVQWLGQQAQALGIEIYAGFPATEVLFNDYNAVCGIATGDMGIGKNSEKLPHYTPGVELHAAQVLLAEGCRGSLSKQVIAHYHLDKYSSSQTYGLGIKEVWRVPQAQHQPGLCLHSIGWPLDSRTYGGSWLYHGENNTVSVGFVVGLDYKNPYLSPYEEMQRFKTHPAIRKHLEGGERMSYGARALVEGGLQSLPKLTFPGGALVGDCAGFLNVAKIKGNHTAMKSGMLAAEALADVFEQGEGPGAEPASYLNRFRNSWLWQELHEVRNIRPGFRYGLWAGLVHAVLQTLTRGKLPYTLRHHADHTTLKHKRKVQSISYPKPDGILTFDKLTSVSFSNVHHIEDQPCHLKLQKPQVAIEHNFKHYDSPETRYCPAGVYEIVQENGLPQLHINAQNCIHCKSCDIKDPTQNINWVPPEGGGGPNYSGM